MFTRAAIADYVWSYDAVVQSNVVDVYVHHLRRKLDAVRSARMIETVRSAGYRLAIEDDNATP